MKNFLIIILLTGFLVMPLPGAEEKAKRELTPVEKSIARGIAYLLSQQNDEGAIGAKEDKRSNANAFTGLSLMAMIAVGHQPKDETPEGRALAKALDFILKNDRMDETGYYGKADGSRMYGHGIVTLMLSEMVGMGVDARQDSLIRERCQKAVDLIVRAQNIDKHDQRFKGGWRYQPDAHDADLSVTVWQVMALRAAKNAGLVVPKETIDSAIRYIKASYHSNRDQDGRPLNLNSAFAYQPGGGPSYSTASMGLLALQICGEYDAPELKGTVAWLREQKVKTSHRFFYYGTYYYTQGMYQRGGELGKEALKEVENVFLAEQKEDGSWQGHSGEGMSKTYSTALAILSLSVNCHFMPIYQR
ncbi:MAG: terpene cyclase/mutase family protein [Kiritimatiellae bacterium]|nr:terpene cyclase/mutase family protein [Kiritimatiellia bacterium]MDD5522451.1 terpene cyclase/mutase family protein [Kiritimatiellia bacterium]